MASNITDPITASFKFSHGLGRYSKEMNPNTKREIEKAQRKKAELTGTDSDADVGSSEISALNAKKFTDNIVKVKQSVLNKPFKPKPYKPAIVPPPVVPIINTQHPTNPQQNSNFFQTHANKFKRPKF
jgi:hypothetical protein